MNFEFLKSDRELGRELVKSYLFELNVDYFDNSKKSRKRKTENFNFWKKHENSGLILS